MNQETWSKSLLAAYTVLPAIVKSIDRRNLNEALGSFSYPCGTMDTIDAIVKNISRKEALINVKVIVDNALASLKPDMRRVLELKYLKGMKCEDIAAHENISLRNVFRRQNIALECFGKYCERKGYDSEWLEKRYARDPLFVKINERICEKERSDKAGIERRQSTKKAVVAAVATVLSGMQKRSIGAM